MTSLRNREFLSVLAFLLVTVVLMVCTYLRWLPLNFTVGPFRFTHWLSWMGTILIAVFTPVFYILRRRYPKRNLVLTKLHIFSNLVSFLLVSIHFAQQMSRSVHPEDRTGLTIYLLVCILVLSGVLHRFQVLGKGRLYPPHRNRFLHVSITSAFYLVVGIHTLHNLGLL
jgi:hypothetical protein